MIYCDNDRLELLLILLLLLVGDYYLDLI